MKKCSLKTGACSVAMAMTVFAGMGVIDAPQADAMVVYDPTNHTETLASKLQLIKNYEKQLQQYDAQLKQLAKLDPSQLSSSIKEVQSMVSEMNNIRTSVNAIGNDFKSAQEQFDNVFVDYKTWNGASAKSYSDQAARVNDTVEKGIKQSIVSQGLASPEEMQKTADSLSTLLEASQNADGVMGATQAASQIAGLQVKEIQRMEAIMSDSMKGQNLYLQKKIQSEKASEKLAEQFYQEADFGTSTVGSRNSADIKD